MYPDDNGSCPPITNLFCKCFDLLPFAHPITDLYYLYWEAEILCDVMHGGNGTGLIGWCIGCPKVSGNLMHHKREQYCVLNNMTHFFILQVMKNLMNYVLTLVLNWMKWYSLADSCFIFIFNFIKTV